VKDTAEEARHVRDEDAFDISAVAGWLREHADPAYVDDLAGTPEVRQFPGGASNLTYLLRYPARDLILRRPPAGVKAKGAHDMGREFRIQSALKPVFAQVPAMVAYAGEDGPIGSPFYVMERVVGTIPRRDLDVPASTGNQLCASFWDVLVELHSVDIDSVPELASLGRGDGYVARQVSGWTDRLGRAATDDMGDWSPITSWLAAHQPADVAQTLIHNDFRLDNVVLSADDPTRIVGVLDWEMATVGDPLMDLGTTLGYWLDQHDPDELRALLPGATTAPGGLSRADVLQRYAARTGRDVGDGVFHYAFGLFKIAVIMQQIYARHRQGLTSDPRFASLGDAVAACAGAAAAAIDRGSV